MPVAAVATGAAGGVGAVPVPLTAMVCAGVMPPPLMVRLPERLPEDCGEKRTYTGVLASVAPLYGIVAVLAQVLLSEETWKSDEGAVTVMFPGAPVRFDPEILKVWLVEKLPIVTDPKSLTVPVMDMEGAAGVEVVRDISLELPEVPPALTARTT